MPDQKLYSAIDLIIPIHWRTHAQPLKIAVVFIICVSVVYSFILNHFLVVILLLRREFAIVLLV